MKVEQVHHGGSRATRVSSRCAEHELVIRLDVYPAHEGAVEDRVGRRVVRLGAPSPGRRHLGGAVVVGDLLDLARPGPAGDLDVVVVVVVVVRVGSTSEGDGRRPTRLRGARREGGVPGDVRLVPLDEDASVVARSLGAVVEDQQVVVDEHLGARDGSGGATDRQVSGEHQGTVGADGDAQLTLELAVLEIGYSGSHWIISLNKVFVPRETTQRGLDSHSKFRGPLRKEKA